jgi:hypothetical protein
MGMLTFVCTTHEFRYLLASKKKEDYNEDDNDFGRSKT